MKCVLRPIVDTANPLTIFNADRVQTLIRHFEANAIYCRYLFRFVRDKQKTVKQYSISKSEQKQKAFTMLELLIVIVIVALLLGVAAANFTPLIQRTQSNDVSEQLRASVNFARGESIVRGGWVGICGSADGASCQDSFKDGWLVFQDLDRDGSFSASDLILNRERQDNGGLQLDVEELTAGLAGPLLFNFKGFPNRALRFTAAVGDSVAAFEVKANGVIEPI